MGPAGITDIINFLSMSCYREFSSSKKSTEGASSSRGMGGGRSTRSILAKEAEREKDLKDLRREREEFWNKVKKDEEDLRRGTEELWKKVKKEAKKRGEMIHETDDGGYFRTKSTSHHADDSYVLSELSDGGAS